MTNDLRPTCMCFPYALDEIGLAPLDNLLSRDYTLREGPMTMKTFTREEALVYFASRVLAGSARLILEEDRRLVADSELFLWSDGLYHDEVEQIDTLATDPAPPFGSVNGCPDCLCEENSAECEIHAQYPAADFTETTYISPRSFRSTFPAAEPIDE